ncbi:hypothetical protein C8Q79DRAFT_923822 [Trametes meyenii]|nr:hypothetical protein C8Q79DRAFT_923822 [Trametes meyenii]
MSTQQSHNKEIAILGKQRGMAPVSNMKGRRGTQVTYHDIPIIPETPLSIGQRICLYTLKGVENPFGRGQGVDNGEGEPVPCYTISVTGVAGPIVGIRAMDQKIVELIVRNDRMERSMVAYAYITVKNLHGVTTNLPMWRRAIAATGILGAGETRDVPLEMNAIVLSKAAREPPQST